MVFCVCQLNSRNKIKLIEIGGVLKQYSMYSLYKHQNVQNGKVYIGISSKNPITRWDEGNGYKSNKEFYSDICLYGWDDGFTHEILLNGLSKSEAKIKECEYILKYDSVRTGYNQKYADKKALLPPDLLDEVKNRQKKLYVKKEAFTAKNFDMYNFKVFNDSKNKYCKVPYFTRIPNIFIQHNIQKDFGINKIFIYVYCAIDRNRSYEDTSFVCIKDILDSCQYKATRHKPKIFYEILKCLIFLKENNYIECDFDIYKVNYNDCIKVKIISKTFDAIDNYTMLYGETLDTISQWDTKPTKESIISVFLYINSYIFIRPKNKDNVEIMYNPESKPEAFFRSIEVMSKDLGMSKDTINQCLQYLTSNINCKKPLLIKREVGSIQPNPKKPPQNVPNIYVLNKEGYEQEIKWAISKMLEIYNVDSFGELTGKDVK